MTNLNKLFRQARIEAEVSQAAVARKFGWASPQFVSNIERNKAHYPLQHFKELSKFLKVPAKLIEKAYVKDAHAEIRKIMK